MWVDRKGNVRREFGSLERLGWQVERRRSAKFLPLTLDLGMCEVIMMIRPQLSPMGFYLT